MEHQDTHILDRESFNAASRGDGFVAEFKVPTTASSKFKAEVSKDFIKDFKKAFNGVSEDGVRGESLGLLIKYSYYDTNPKTWGEQFQLFGSPWDNLVSQGHNYKSFPNEEVRTINMAIRDGVLDNLPANIHYISLGPGAAGDFKAKECLILSGLTASGHTIKGATIVDIHNRYAIDAASKIYDMFNTDAIAFGRDFFANGISDVAIKPNATPVIGVFGGTLQNIPQIRGHKPDQDLVDFYKMMHKGIPNAHMLMTVDTTPKNVEPPVAVAAYEYNLEIELFVLNFMARAKEQGLIKNEGYDILKNWKMVSPEWKDNSVNIFIQAKRDHVLQTIDGDYNIKAGDRVSVSKSRKGPIEDHIKMLETAGFKSVEAYPQNSFRNTNSPTKYIIHAAP